MRAETPIMPADRRSPPARPQPSFLNQAGRDTSQGLTGPIGTIGRQARPGYDAPLWGKEAARDHRIDVHQAFRCAVIGRYLFGGLLALLSSLMLGFAAGAVWMLATLFAQHLLPWLALPVGWVLGLTVRRWVWPGGIVAAVIAAGITVLAGIYVAILLAALQIAGGLGLGLIEALQTAGLGMLLSIVRLALTVRPLAWLLAGAAVAAWIAHRRPRRTPPPTAPAS